MCRLNYAVTIQLQHSLDSSPSVGLVFLPRWEEEGSCMAVTQLAVRCARCGCDEFEVPGNPKPDDTIKCLECSAVVMYRDVERAPLTAGIRAIKELERRGKVGLPYS